MMHLTASATGRRKSRHGNFKEELVVCVSVPERNWMAVLQTKTITAIFVSNMGLDRLLEIYISMNINEKILNKGLTHPFRKGVHKEVWISAFLTKIPGFSSRFVKKTCYFFLRMY